MRRPKTTPMGFGNKSFLIDRNGRDCPPHQFVREGSKNGEEAILRQFELARAAGEPEEPGEIVWDVYWPALDENPGSARKLCVIDNGTGMTPEEIKKFINKVAPDEGHQSLDGNFGMGIKIAALTQNPAGLLYLSWKRYDDGVVRGIMARLWRDPVTGDYGLYNFQDPNDEDVSYEYQMIDDSLKPDTIKDHGTVVVFLGTRMAEDDEHFFPIDDTTRSSHSQAENWVIREIAARYFRFPENIRVRVREDMKNRHSPLKYVRTQSEYLAMHSDASGTVPLWNATAHWWLLKNRPSDLKDWNINVQKGHVAILFQDELYDMKRFSQGGSQMLQRFGITLGMERVVLYIEPHSTPEYEFDANTPRTHIRVNKQELPWAQWEAEFHKQMPKPLAEMIGQLSEQSHKSGLEIALERLKRISFLLDIPKLYTKSKNGVTPIGFPPPKGGHGEHEEQGQEQERGPGPKPEQDPKNRRHKRTDTVGGPHAGEEVPKGDRYPKVQWVTLENGLRQKGDELENRAARYLFNDNTLQINGNFRVFDDMVYRLQEEFPGYRDHAKHIESVVHGWFVQELVAAVISMRTFHQKNMLNSASAEIALSIEALTAVACTRFNVYENSLRELRQYFKNIRPSVLPEDTEDTAFPVRELSPAIEEALEGILA